MTAALRSCNNDYAMATRIMRLALTFVFTTRGIPQIYYGTEVGLEGGSDPDNRRDFPWQFIDSKNEVLGAYPHQKSIFTHLKKLISLRKETPALYAGYNVCLFVDHFVLANLYYVEDSIAITIIHNGWDAQPEKLKISIAIHPSLPSRIRNKIDNREYTCSLTGKKIKIRNGEFEVQMEGKTGYLFLCRE
jgi:alpha-amylase